MPFVGTGLQLEQLNEREWETLAPLTYQGRDTTTTLTVPTGFKTDLTSVPRFAWWLVPRSGRYTPASVLHDYLVRTPEAYGIGRCDADGIFRRSMRELGVPLLRRRMMWTAVRLSGGPHRCGWRMLLAVLVISILVAAIVIPGAIIVTLLLFGFWLIEVIIYVVWKLRWTLGIWKPHHQVDQFPTLYWWT